jgi:cytochrome P450
MIALARNPDQYARLRADPEPLSLKVMELARYAPGVWATARTANEDLEFQGVEIPAGTQIWSNVMAGNSDPDAFSDPGRLDLDAKRRNPPLNWGLGVHSCLGRFLATLEIEEVLRLAIRRWEELELVGEPTLEGIPTLVSPRGLRLRCRAR